MPRLDLHGGRRGQSSVEFAASAIVLFLLLFGLIDLGRVFYFDVGLSGATREAARLASWFVLPAAGSGLPGLNPSLYDDDGWTQDPCPYEPGGNPTGDPNPNQGIKQSVDCNLNKYHLPSSVLQNPATTCPTTTDGNGSFNPPYVDSTTSRLTSSTVSSDRKSTRLNSSHTVISYAVFCLKKKKNTKNNI